jgi:murein DD-endopeptidase
MAYAWPTPSTDWVTCSWACHRDRNPPSSEPGTDIGSSYGAQVIAVEEGVVTYVKHSNSGATGRVVEYVLNDGRTTRTLHMAEVWVAVGEAVYTGTVLGLSGASGYGDDWYYGPHAHQTLWDGPAWSGPTIDFELYVGSNPGPIPGPTPIEEDTMNYLLQIDPNSDGRWFLVDFSAGTAQRIYNGLQLDLIKRDPNVNQVFGGQPIDVIAGLTIGGE